mgnify:CR=1 FL=1
MIFDGFDTMKLRKACEDLKIFLDRGFKKSSVVKFIASYYGLPKEAVSILNRCIHPTWLSSTIAEKILDPSEVKGRSLGIDGFNNLITIESIISGHPVILCDDSLIRDIRERHSYRFSDKTEYTVQMLLKQVSALHPSYFEIVLDAQISKSGELSKFINSLIEEMGLADTGCTLTTKRTDRYLISKGYDVVASSDVDVVSKVNRIIDIPAMVLKDLKREFLKIDLGKAMMFILR